MKIIINNTPEVIERPSITISELLEFKRFTFRMLVVRLNGNLVKKHEFDTTSVNDGDDVQVLHLISGG